MRKILQEVVSRLVPGVSGLRSSTDDSPKRKTTLLLDEPLFGLDEFLQDFGWSTVKVTRGMNDDEVMKLAKANDYVLVSPDRRFVDRGRLQGING